MHESVYIDKQEQSKIKLQVQETIEFIVKLFTPQELQELNTENKSFKNYLLENKEDLYPSIITNQDIEKYIRKLKSKKYTIKIFVQKIKENLFVNKTSFIFNKQMKLEIEKFFNNPIRLRIFKLGLKTCSEINLLVTKIPESIKNKLSIYTNNQIMTFEEQLFARYKNFFHKSKYFAFLKTRLKKLESRFEELQNKSNIDSLNKQKLLVCMDRLLFSKNIFRLRKKWIGKFFFGYVDKYWKNFTDNKPLLIYKIDLICVCVSIFVIVLCISFTAVVKTML